MAKDRASQLIDAGLWLRMSGDSDGATQLFERALGIDPENTRLRGLLDATQAPSNDVPTASAQPVAAVKRLKYQPPPVTPAESSPPPPVLPVEPVLQLETIAPPPSETLKEVHVSVMALPAPIQSLPPLAMPVEPALAAVLASGSADTWLRDGASLPIEDAHPIMLWQTEDLDGRYRIVEKLASGGMGDVYKAVHKELDKRVAIKVMKRELGNAPDFVERFKREAVACSHIGQHNIVDISDFGRTSDGRFYFVMEYLEGKTLTELLRDEQRLSVARAVKICLQIARALGAAHSQGIVHRDLKPDNVIIVQTEDRPDFVKVLDFGVAKVTDESTASSGVTTTGAGMLMGTPQYMSPEQASALPVDARSDIYSLGLILYELVTGRPTFQGETPSLVIAAQIHQLPPPMTTPSGSSPIPTELEAIVMSMLLKRPGQRPQSMPEVINALDHVLHGPSAVSVPARPVTLANALPPVELELPRSRHPFALGLVVAVAALATLGWAVKTPATRPARAIQTTAHALTVAPRTAQQAEVIAEPPPETLTVMLESRPSNVTVLANDVIVGTTPMRLEWERGRTAELRFKRDGFAPTSRTIAPQSDLSLTVDLAPLSARRASAASSSSKRPVDNLKDLPY